ncbi:hypothetical protein PCO80_14690 [Pectobacteriaceae bacterium C80]|nr:hypothetical protein PCO80_14690 [Pectobacteriaceae bacterium C80]
MTEKPMRQMVGREPWVKQATLATAVTAVLSPVRRQKQLTFNS